MQSDITIDNTQLTKAIRDLRLAAGSLSAEQRLKVIEFFMLRFDVFFKASDPETKNSTKRPILVTSLEPTKYFSDLLSVVRAGKIESLILE